MRTFRKVSFLSLVKFTEDEFSHIYNEKTSIFSYRIEPKEHERIINLCDEDFVKACDFIYEKTLKLQEKNYNLAKEIQDKLNIGIISCGNCGGINLHKCNNEEKFIEEIVQCEHCNSELDFCHCPDLFQNN